MRTDWWDGAGYGRTTEPFAIPELQNPSWDDTEQQKITALPKNSFTILEPRDQEIDEFYLVQERRATDFEAPKLGKGSSGS